MKNGQNNQTKQLLVLAKAGDTAALNKLCAVYSERVRRIVRLRMGNELRSRLESMNLVQDAFISALRGLDNFTYQNEGDFLRWISKIAENRLRDNLDLLHADKRDIRKEIPLKSNRQDTQSSFIATNDPVSVTTPSIIMSKREDLNKLEKAIDNLKPEYKEILILIRLENLSYKEAADKLGKTPDAVRMLLARAMSELSRDFEKTQ
jgi:RNA polymerase sigma-70 factor (ECF subfamily)